MLRSFTVARFSRLLCATALFIGFTTLIAVAQPSIQVSNVTVGLTGVSWTNGNGSNRLVVVSHSGGVFTPVNGTDYTADISADFNAAADKDGGAGGPAAKIVYGGTGNTMAVANLPTATFLTIKVYEFNGAFQYNLTDAINNPIVTWYYLNSGATTTYVVPAGVTGVVVQAWGGGGGGGWDAGASNGAAGGGGGAYSSGVTPVVFGTNPTVTIGAGGTGGTTAPVNGTAGGSSSFGASIIALGGGVNNGTAGASGGSGPSSTGTTKFSGGNGGNGGAAGGSGGGGGGSSGTAAGVGVNGGNFSTGTGGTGGNGTDGDGGNGGNGTSGATAAAGTFPGGGGGGRGDGNGNSAAGAGGLIIVTYAVPEPPSTPDLTTDTGSSAADNITNDNTPTFAGTAEAGSTVTIISSVDGVVGTGTATGGNYSITVSTLAGGAHNITATATNTMGNVSAASSALGITIDTSAPSAPSVPDLTTDTGSSAADDITNDNTPTFDGTAETGSTVTISSNIAGAVGTGTATGGNYSITVSTLTSVAHNITATATDAAGNTSVASAALPVIIDTTAPTVVLDDNHADAIVRDADNVTIAAIFTEANGIAGTPTITIGSVVTNQLMLGGPLTWTAPWDVPAGNDGPHAVSITATDMAGNASAAPTVGTGQTTYTIDNIAPTVISSDRLTPAGALTNAGSVIFRVTFDASVTGVDAADFTASLTGVTAGAITTVTGAGAVYDVTVPTIVGNGTVRLDVLNTATIADVSGNSYVTNFTTGQVYNIDQTPPTVVLDDNHADAIVRDADNVTITATFTDANGISGTPTINIGSVVTAQNMSGGPLVWTYAWNVPSGNDGVQAVSISATDGAGNANAAPTVGTGTLSYTIDNTAPTVSTLVRQTPPTSPTNATSVTFRLTFNENVSNVDLADFELNPTNTATGTLSGVTNPTPFTVYDVTANPVAGSGDILNLDIAAVQDITDVAGNAYVIAAIGGEQEYVIDNTAPFVSPNEMTLNLNGAGAETIVFTLNEELSAAAGAVVGFSASTGSIATAIYSGKGTTNTITLTSAADGQWTTGTTVSYTPGTLADLIGNAMAAIVNHVVIQSIVNLNPGDIAFTSFRTDDPNNFSFVLLKDISAGTQIKFTNNGWKNDNSFRTGEETITWTADVDYFAGLEVTFTGDPYTASHGTKSGDGDLELSTSGDQILAYQGSSASPTFLAAIQFNASSWEANATNDQTSAAPTGLAAAHYALIGSIDNAAYNVPGGEITTGSVTVLRANINAVANWDTDNNPANVTFPTAGLTNFVLPPDLVGSPFSPANGSIVPGTLPNLSITYDDNVIAGSSTGADIQLLNQTTGGTIIATWNVGTAAVTFSGATANINTGGSVSLVNGHLYRIVVAKRVFLNADGNGNTAISGATWQFTADVVTPTVSNIIRQTPSTTLTNATSVVFRVTFSEAVQAATVQAADFTVTQTNLNFGALSVSQISPTVYDVTVPSLSLIAAGSNGTIRLDVNNGTATISDVPGNTLNTTFNTGESYTIDHTAPTVTSINRKTPLTASTNATTVVYQVTFSEDIDHTTFTDADLTKTLSGVTVGAATITETSPGVFDVSLPTVSGDGTIRIDLLPGAAISDLAGNDYNATFNTGEVYTIDQAMPTVVAITRQDPVASPTNASTVKFTVEFSEAIDGPSVDLGDFTFTFTDVNVSTGSVSQQGDPKFFTLELSGITIATPSVDGTIDVDVPASATITDAVGNDLNTAFTVGETYTIDQTAPVIQDIVHNPALFNAWAGTRFLTTPAYNGDQVDFTFTFSEPVNNLGAAQVSRTVNTGSVNFPPVSTDMPPDIIPVDAGGVLTTAPSRYWKIVFNNVGGSGFIFPPYLNVGSAVTDAAGNVETHTTTTFFGFEDGIDTRFYFVTFPQPTLEVSDASFTTASAPTTTSITLQWNHSGGAQRATDYVIRAKESSIVSFPPGMNIADGTFLSNDLNAADSLMLQHVNSNAWPSGPASQTVSFTGLKSGVSYDFEIYPYAKSDNHPNFPESYDYNTTNFATFTVSTTTAPSAVITNLGGLGILNSFVDTQAEALFNFQFTVTDEIITDVDNAPFKFSGLTFFQGTDNDITDWTQALAGAELSSSIIGSTPIVVTPTATANGSISASQINFASIPSTAGPDLGFVPDGTSPVTYRLRVWLKSSLEGTLPTTIDNLNFTFLVNNTSFVLNNTSSNQLSTTLQPAQSIQTGINNNRVNVAAAQLLFATPGDPLVNPGVNGVSTNPQPQIGVKNNFPSPNEPRVYALDMNKNMDKDYTGLLTITNTFPLGQLPSPYTTNFPAGGVFILNNYQFTTAGITTIQVAGAGLAAPGTAATSTPVEAVISSLSQITAGTAAPATISSLTTANTGAVAPQLNAVQNFEFTITDDVGANTTTYEDNDGLPTIVDQVIIAQGPGNDAVFGTDWRLAIIGAELSDGSASQTISSTATTFGVITATTLQFDITPGSPMNEIGDDDFKTYSLKIWLRPSVSPTIADLIDNKDLVFSVSNGNIDVGSLNTSSTLQASGTDSGNGNNVIDVDATQIDFTTQWIQIPITSQSYDAPLSPNPIAKARDLNGNLDHDYNAAAAVVTGTPATYPLANSVVTVTNGVLTFNANFQVTSAGGGLNNATTNLVVSSGSLTNGVSNTFQLNYSDSSDIIKDPGFTYPTNIPYATANNQAADITSGTGVAVERFTIRDGGGATDSDGSATKLSGITIRVTNHQYLKRLAIYNEDTGEEVGEADVVGQDVTFSGIPLSGTGSFQAPDDPTPANATNNLIVKVTFKANNVTDNDIISFQVISIAAGGVSSAFASANPSGVQSTVTGDQNKIEVIATQLDFTGIANEIANNSLPFYSASINSPFPAPVGPIFVESRDANANRDVDFTGAITSFTIENGLGTVNGPTGSFAAGTFNFDPNFQYTSGNDEDGDITLNAGGISGTSDDIRVTSSFESHIFSTGISQNIFYINYPEATNIDWITLGNAFPLQSLILSDGDVDGIAGDVDGAETELTSLTLGITNPQSIERIALYMFNAGWTEVAEQPATAIIPATGYGQITFGGLSIKAPDNGQKLIRVVASFKNTPANITDNSIVEVSILAAVSGGGSKFRGDTGDITPGTFIGGVAVSTPPNAPGGTNAGAIGAANTIEVLATQLDFTTQPGEFAGINQPITEPVVEARDANGEVDLDQHHPVLPNPANIATGGAGQSILSLPFASGILNFSGFEYTSIGDGTLTVSSFNAFGNPIQGTSDSVDVIHVTTALATNGVTTANLAGGAQKKVIFGVTFQAPYVVTGEPLIEKFIFTFNTSANIHTVFTNIKVFESTDTQYDPLDDTDVTNVAIGGKVLPSGSKEVTVDFTKAGGVPRDLSDAAGNELTYFLMVDIDASANTTTPRIQPELRDDNVFASLTDLNIVSSAGTAESNLVGTNFNFAAVDAPTLVSSYPASGQINIHHTQPTIELIYTVPVWTMDGKISLYDHATNLLVQELTAINGNYNNGNPDSLAGTPARPLKFNLPTLQPDHLYYVTIPPGEFDEDTPANSIGIMDQFKNVSPGFSFPGTLYFKTAKLAPPQLLGSTKPLPITNISATGATINAIFDQPGKAYFLVTPTGQPVPTNAQIDGTIAYPGAMTGRGSFDINQTHPLSQFGQLNPLTPLLPNTTYDVWIYAESYFSLNGGLTAIPTSDPYGKSPNFVIGGIDLEAGPTFKFTTPLTFPAGVSVNKPNIQICSESFQVLNSPIVIVEGSAGLGDFSTGGTYKSFNMLLPSGFEFDVTEAPGNKPLYGKVTLSGSDFGTSEDSLSFINNSIVRVTFRNSGSSSQDKITITGLRIRGESSAQGPIIRLGGDAITVLPDNNTIFANLATKDAPIIPFTNSYSKINYPTRTPISIIPDNFNDPQFTVQLIPLPLSGDYGPNSFSGPGVNIDQLNLTAVTLGVPFNVIITHTDNNGCISQNPIQHMVYDHEKAIGGLDIKYCIVNPAFPNGLAPTGVDVKEIKYKNNSTSFMRSMSATIPADASPSQIMYDQPGDSSWRKIINALPIQDSVHLIEFYDYTFDTSPLLNAYNISLNDAEPNDTIPEPYSHFARQTLAGNIYYAGGSLGLIEFTGEYENRNNDDLDFPLKQNVEFFLPAIPIIEVDKTNESFLDTTDVLNPVPTNLLPIDPRNSNKGTQVYCEEGGTININGFPAASAGSSVGSFVLVDAESGDTIYYKPVPLPPGFTVTPGFLDNINGTATLDPTILNNNYQDIRIIYTYKENNSPCESSGSHIIRIAPNPVAQFTANSVIGTNTPVSTAYCVDREITFNATTSIGTISNYKWNFGDAANSDGGNPNEPEGGVGEADIQPHTFKTSAPYVTSLVVTSNYGCASQPFVEQIDVGAVPTVKFDFMGVSTADSIVFDINTSNGPSIVNSAAAVNDGFARMIWTYGDTNTDVITTGFSNNVPHIYGNPGIFNVNLSITSIIGCTANLTQPIVILSRETPPVDGAYFEDFQDNNSIPITGNWQHSSLPITSNLTNPSSWAVGAPTTSVIQTDPSITGPSVWKTSLTAGYNPKERSALYSPSFDISNLTRPMISFNSFTQIESSDGVILEYSVDRRNVADPDKEWFALGSIGEGVDWFTHQGIAAKPGKQASKDYGWSGDTKKTWLESKHALVNDNDPQNIKPPIVGAQRVVFRFALASAKEDQSLLDGFAIDNVRIGNRTRIVLLENFRNLGNTESIGGVPIEKLESDELKIFNPSGTANSIVKINYHVAFPNMDPLNMDNKQDPGARALYYNISKTPRVMMDGGTPADALFSTWGETEYNVKSLKLADAGITPVITRNSDGVINITVSVKALKELSASTLMNIAVVEKSIDLASLSDPNLVRTQEVQFEYVLKRLLPSASGTPFNQILRKDSTRVFPSIPWSEPVTLYDNTANDLALVIFLQDEDSKEIYQTHIEDIMMLPPLVTGIETLNTSFKVYPIPADNEMVIELPEPAQKRTALHVYDQLGKVVEQSNFETGDSRKAINTRDFAAGVYLIQIDSPKGILRRKVMVVHKN